MTSPVGSPPTRGDNSYLDDEDIDESLWNSPVKDNATSVPSTKKRDPGYVPPRAIFSARPAYVDQQARDQSLRQELASVRKVNEAIEGVLASLEKAKTNMKARSSHSY